MTLLLFTDGPLWQDMLSLCHCIVVKFSFPALVKGAIFRQQERCFSGNGGRGVLLSLSQHRERKNSCAKLLGDSFVSFKSTIHCNLSCASTQTFVNALQLDCLSLSSATSHILCSCKNATQITAAESLSVTHFSFLWQYGLQL